MDKNRIQINTPTAGNQAATAINVGSTPIASTSPFAFQPTMNTGSSQPVATSGGTQGLQYFGGTAAMPQKYSYNPITGETKMIGDDLSKMAANVPNTTNPNAISSSQSVAQTGQINNATNNAIKTPSSEPTANEKTLMDYYGVDIDTIRNKFSNDAYAIAEAAAPIRQSITEKENIEAEKRKQETAQAEKRAASLSQLSTKFNSMMQDLERQKNGSLSQAKAQAYAANPYATTGTTTAANEQVINSKYARLMDTLSNEYEANRQSIEAGDAKAMARLSQIYSEGIQGINKDLQATLNVQGNQRLTAQQYATSAKNIAQDNLMNMVNTYSTSPELQSDVDSFLTSGKASPALEPFFKQGEAAGLATNEIASMLRYGTDKARKEEAQINLQYARLMASQEKQGYQNLYGMTQQSVLSTANQLSASGVKPNTLDYAINLAMSTAGSPLKLSSADVDKYTNIMSLSQNLQQIKDTISTVNDKSNVIKMAISHAGRSIQSVADKDLAILNSEMNALASRIGKSIFSETGNLSNTDIQRFLSIVPSGATTVDVRNAMYKFITTELASRAALTLQNDAAAFKPVAGFVQPIKTLVEDTNTLVKSIDNKNEIPANIKSIFDKLE